MNRTRIVVGLVAVIVLAVAAYLLLAGREPSAPVTANLTAEEPAQAAGGAPAKPAAPAPIVAAPVPETGSPAAAPAPVEKPIAVVPRGQKPAAEEAGAKQPVPQPAPPHGPPSFDVVRVEPSGEAVIAGRGAPGSEVTVMDGRRPLGKVTANGRGQWVLVLDKPLAPGSHELGLESRGAGDEVLQSENVVVVSVPHPQIAAAPQASEAQAPVAAGAKAQAPETPPRTGEPVAQVAETSPVAPTPAPVPTAERERSQPGTGAPARSAAAPETERPLAVLMPRAGQGPSRILQQPAAITEGLGEGTLVLETVDYDSIGMATVAGRAEPAARLIVYMDNKPVGHVLAAADGRWSLMLDRPVREGLHRLRVDQVDAGGTVLARVETPFSRAAMLAGVPDEVSVIVQPGNSLWRIARRVYGKGLRYSVIYEANRGQIGDPDLIYPGQIFVIPQVN